MLGGIGIRESSASREQQLVMLAELDLATSAAGTAARLQRATATDLRREARLAKALRGDAYLDGVSGGAADCPALEIDGEVVLAEATLHDLALRHGGQHLDVPFRQLLTNRPVAIGGVAEHTTRPTLLGLSVDQVLGLRSVVLPTRRDVHGRDQWLRAVGGGRRELVAVKTLLAALAAVAYLGVDRRDDPVATGPTMQARHAVLVDVEVLADQFAQQLVRRLRHIIIEQPRRPLDRGQRPLGILGHPGEHPLPLGFLPPATIRLLARPRIVKLKPPIESLASI